MKRIKTERELKGTEAQQTLYMGLAIKWGLTGASITAIAGLVILVGLYMFDSPDAQKTMFDQVKDNLGSIAVSIAIFLGLKKSPKLSE